MKLKNISKFCLGVLFSLSLASCDANKVAENYYLDSENNLIVVYNNGEEANLGSWGDSIISSIGTVAISNDGYYIINGVKTEIKDRTIQSYFLNNNGELVIVYTDGHTENLGKLGDSFINGVTSLSISNDGYYVLNGIKTSIKSRTIKSYSLNDDGQLVVTYSDGKSEILGELGSSIINGINTVTISDDGYYVINGIKTDISAVNVYTVKFNTGCSTTVPNQKVKDGYKVERPTISRTGYTLNGWYNNGEEWRFNSDVVKSDMTLTADWNANQYTVTFINEKGTSPAEMIVTYDQNTTLPSVDSVTGYTFAGWYNGNTKVSSGKWAIANDVTLTAKWTANTNIITLDANGGSVSKTSVTVTYGKDYKLPIPTNDYGVFLGWLYDGELITDDEGNSLSPWLLTTDIEVTVDWTIKLYTYEDLDYLQTYKNAEFILMNDIDLNGKFWEPVGSAQYPFTGKFNGNGKSIKNLSIDTADYVGGTDFGFFGYVKNAEFANLNIENFKFESENLSKVYYAGALFARSHAVSSSQIIISNVKVTGTYSVAKQSSTTPSYVGGLTGYCYYGVFERCTSNVSISESTYAGGINAYGYATVYSQCFHEGDISGSVFAGGFFGINLYYSYAIESGNKGNVTGVIASGGIGGSAGEIAYADKCFNYGDIVSTGGADATTGSGGIFGCCYSIVESTPSATITNCYNRGDISAPYAGGIIGGCFGLTVKNCYNAGIITGEKYAGGIYASSAGTHSEVQCLATGSIAGGTCKSTIGGGISAGSSLDCYYTYTSTGSYLKVTGTYTNASCYGSDLYKNNLYWTEYNEETKTGIWVFNESDYPTLHCELAFVD